MSFLDLKLLSDFWYLASTGIELLVGLKTDLNIVVKR